MAHAAALGALGEPLAAGALGPGGLHALVGILLAVHMTVAAVPGVFLGLGSVVFLALLYRTGLVPRALAGFGVVSYVLVSLLDAAMILAPGLAMRVRVQVVGWGPSVVFELAIGAWLLARGVTVAPAPSPEPTP